MKPKCLLWKETKGELVFKNGTRESKKTTLNEARKEAREFVEVLAKKNGNHFEVGMYKK